MIQGYTYVRQLSSTVISAVPYVQLGYKKISHIPGLDSYFLNRNQFSITSGQEWWKPMLCTVKWVKKSPVMVSSTWALNSFNCSENYTKTKKKKNMWLVAAACENIAWEASNS